MNSYLDSPDKAVKFDVQMQSLPDGTSYPGSIVLAIPKDNIELRISKSNYQKLAQWPRSLGCAEEVEAVTKRVVFALAVLVALPIAAAAQAPVSQTEAVEVTAKIEAIDKAGQLVTLRDEDGELETIYCGPQVKRFDELKLTAGQAPPAAAPAAGAPAAGAPSAADLAKKLANPISDLVSIPFQFNWDEGVGPNDDLRFLLNIQPVVPAPISDRWNLIGRFILPIVSQPVLVPGGEPTFGTGDILLSTFFSPRESKLIWGVGPVFSLPTTTDPYLGSGQWSIGPTAVVLKQQGAWTFGALVNQLWSVARTGDGERDDVNQLLLQPFLAHSSKSGLTLTLSSEATANWEAASGEQWTVPLILQVSKVTRLGPFPFSMGLAGGYYLEEPGGGPKWKLRMLFALLLPRASPRGPA